VNGQPAVTKSDNSFEGKAAITAGDNTITVAATDTNGNTATNRYNVTVTGSGSKTLVYDLNGNLTSDGTRTFEWDPLNRLTAVNSGTQRSEFTYNGLSQRVKIVEKTNGSVTSTKQFVWCPGDPQPGEERDGSNNVTKRYYTQGVQIGSTNYYYTRDHLGSIRELTNGSGTVQTRYDYDPYGRRTRLTGTLDADFGFTGHYYHQLSGLHLALYRAYNADLGRWISRDSIAEQGGINLYAYVGNNPVKIVDPLGLWQITVGGGAGLGFLISFGNNGGSNPFNGQWNIEGNVGLGGGLFGELDTGDSPCPPSGSTPHLRAHGDLSGKIKFATGQQRGVSLAADATYDNTNGFQFNGPTFGAGLPVHAGGSADHFTLSAGAGWFVGAGVTGYQ
jgi:RHS repeat-associated protein